MKRYKIKIKDAYKTPGLGGDDKVRRSAKEIKYLIGVKRTEESVSVFKVIPESNNYRYIGCYFFLEDLIPCPKPVLLLEE